MNSFVITAGVYVAELMEEAKAIAEYIGKVHVDGSINRISASRNL